MLQRVPKTPNKSNASLQQSPYITALNGDYAGHGGQGDNAYQRSTSASVEHIDVKHQLSAGRVG